MEVGFRDRQLIETEARPELLEAFVKMMDVTFAGSMGPAFGLEIFGVASLGAGCAHCQAHAGYGLSLFGVDVERIRDLWSFQTSERFSGRERAALHFALAAAKSPSQVTPEHHEEVRKHYSNREFADILAIVALAGWLNRWNDSSAVVTDQESVDWAKANLTQVGWKLGRHEGQPGEQRTAHPFTEAMRANPFARK